MGRDGGLLRDMEADLLALPPSSVKLPKPETSSEIFTPNSTGWKERQGIFSSSVLMQRFGGHGGVEEVRRLSITEAEAG